MSTPSAAATWWDHFRRDLRHAVRAIGRMPVLATVVVLSLGVGIGANTTVFSWVQALMLNPIPGVAQASSYLLIEPRGENGSYPGTSWAEYRDLREGVRSFRTLLAFRMVPFNVGEAPRTERTYGQLVSGNYFSALGLRPALGRFLSEDEGHTAGSAPVAVISHEYWQVRYGGAANVLGRVLRVNGQALSIIGVTPEGFQGTTLSLQFDIWVPATMAPVLLAGSQELQDRSQRGYTMMGQLAAKASRADAEREVGALMRQLAVDHRDANAGITAEVLASSDTPRGPQRMMVRGLLLLQGVMLLLLLAVCGNTANLLLARASTRQREIGVRLALGAGRGRIASLLLTENLVLAVLGSLLGVAIAVWGSQALRAVPITGAFPVKFQTSVDLVGLSFAILLGLACGLIFGLAPAAQLARLDPQLALRSGANIAPRSRLRNILMGTEVGLAIIVLVVAALFFRSFTDTRGIDPGFRRDGVLLAAYDLGGRNESQSYTRTFAATLLERLRALPGVESAALATSVPLDIHGLPLRSFAVEGRARADDAPDRALSNVVSPGYFQTLGIPLVAGADFANLTDVSSAPQVIVNQAFVSTYLPNAEPIGRRLTSRGRTYVIAGVARTTLYNAFGEAPTPIIYFSYRDRPSEGGQIHLRTRMGAEALLTADIQKVVRDLDPALPIYDIRTMHEHVEKNLFLRRIPARMFVVLGPLLLVMAAIGIYAVVAYAVAHRTAEIGLRLALGATSRRVVTQIIGETLRVIAYGAAIGWLLVLVVDRHIIPGRPLDLAAFIGVPLVLLSVALFACWLPAQRATRVDPGVALRPQ